jgi:adenine-specific DNA methylase
MIEKNFDISFIADLALREKQIQQNYRPIIAVHKWFARRPGTLFRGLLLSEFSADLLRKAFYQPQNFLNTRVADPFMGGGTPLLEANRVGCDVIGFDINPMSYWIVKQEIEHLDLDAYGKAASLLRSYIENEIGQMYQTHCINCKSFAYVKYFLWVKTVECKGCGKGVDFFPGYLLSSNVRHPKNVLVCSCCGRLAEVEDKNNPGKCCHCDNSLKLKGPATRNRCKCSHCGTVNSLPNALIGPPRHRLFAIEYHCPNCKRRHTGRFFKMPDAQDHSRVKEAETRWNQLQSLFVPDDEIPTGDETNRLHRWGYKRYREMFNSRQLLGLELSARFISGMADDRIRNALATNFSDLLRYQNMLCRYDTMALKSLDIFSVHGFPVGLVQCESNFLGIFDTKKNSCIGSGGWKNIIEKFSKAKAYCDEPFEVLHQGSRKQIVPIRGEWIGDHIDNGKTKCHRMVDIRCDDAATADLPDCSLDAVFTDPPYFSNVQYAELMDFCYIWLRKLIGKDFEAFYNKSTRNNQELTGNVDMGRDLEHFTNGLSCVFQKMSKALKPGAPLAFTYHHNAMEAYLPLAVAILDSGFTCSAALPCPAEMGASIHINGTCSSIIDTVFVCRATGVIPRRSLSESPAGIAALVREDVEKLLEGNVKPTSGDIRCITYGHLVRMAIWNLKNGWSNQLEISKKLDIVDNWLKDFGDWAAVEVHLNKPVAYLSDNKRLHAIRETPVSYGAEYAFVAF